MADREDRTAGESPADPPLVERTVPPGSDERAGAVWTLKERIRRLEGLLDQRRAFFDATYRQSTCYLAVRVGSAPAGGPDGGATAGRSDDRTTAGGGPAPVVGFASVRPDGYLSLLGVAPGYRRTGLGSRLLERAVEDHPAVGCHVRVSNDRALGFYLDHGFVVDGRENGYYRDGTDAYRLVRDSERADRVADAVE
jgi:ribosomal protein S18 acetylase RimI-like enzyme